MATTKYFILEVFAHQTHAVRLAAYKLMFNPQYSTGLSLNLSRGYKTGRPSEIKIQAKFEGSSYQLRVGGKVKEIAQGAWNILL